MDQHSALGSHVHPHASLWHFAQGVYQAGDVERRSLELQETYQVNINILLWCAWLECENIRIPLEDMDTVISGVDPVSLDTLERLRGARRVLLSGGNFTKVQVQSIKKQILQAELAIEKVMLHRLQDTTCRILESRDYAERLASAPSQVTLDAYLNKLAVQDSEAHAEAILAVCRDEVPLALEA